MADVRQVIEAALKDAELSWESPEPGTYVVTLPGTRKLSTTCSLRVGRHSLSVNAFVVRHPDENEPAVHRWLLERNLRLYGVSYAVDRLGDVYLAGKLPLSSVTPDELDRLLGVGPGGGGRFLQHPAGAGVRVARSGGSTRGGCRGVSRRGTSTRSPS